jgi:hypothetical protein
LATLATRIPPPIPRLFCPHLRLDPAGRRLTIGRRLANHPTIYEKSASP